jgi:hypothetical protein
MALCAYCSNDIETPHPVAVDKGTELVCCSGECAGKTSEFLAFFRRFKPAFAAGLALSLVVLFAGVFVLSAQVKLIGGLLMGTGFSLMGLTVVLFPFATPQTFSMLNIRKAVRYTRLIGICAVAILLS